MHRRRNVDALRAGRMRGRSEFRWRRAANGSTRCCTSSVGAGCTNVLVEGGAKLLGECFDGRHVDEVHVFIAPKIVGGDAAPAPVGGVGLSQWRKP